MKFMQKKHEIYFASVIEEIEGANGGVKILNVSSKIAVTAHAQ